MPLARVGERELTAPCVQLIVGRGQFPRTRIGIVRDSMHAPRVLHFSAFHWTIDTIRRTPYSIYGICGWIRGVGGIGLSECCE